MQQILLPVHIPNHWGLVFIDLLYKTLYFDNGLKYIVPSSLLSTVQQLLNLLLEMLPSNLVLQSKFWEFSSGFLRCGMPSQAAVDSRMISVERCGVGSWLQEISFSGADDVWLISSGHIVRWMCIEIISCCRFLNGAIKAMFKIISRGNINLN